MDRDRAHATVSDFERPAVARRLLVIAYYYPPCPGIGGVRWAAMSHYLRQLGFAVTVVTTNIWGSLPDDDVEGVSRIGDIRTSRVVRPMLRRFELPTPGYEPERQPSALLTKIIVPEPKVATWLPMAMRPVRRLVARGGFHCLVTTSPAESTHLLGLALGDDRPAWVADFRDGWTFEPLRERFPTAAQRWLDSWLEQRVARTADAVVGATQPIAMDLETRLGAHAVHVPNGWDPRHEPVPTAPPPSSPANAARLVYTGGISARRNLAPFLEALKVVNSTPVGRSVRLVYAGPLSEDVRELIARAQVERFVDDLGVLDRSDSIALQRSADALLLLTSRNSSEATGKIFEYLSSRRPIVALAEGNEAARIVRETNTGATVPPDDVDAIVAALRKVASGQIFESYLPAGLERFTYPGPAQVMADVIEQAISRRARHAK